MGIDRDAADTISCLHAGTTAIAAFAASAIGSSARPLKAEHRLRVAVAQVIGNLARLQQHVQRHDGRARLENAEIDRGKIRKVRAQQRDVIAAPDAGRRERIGDLIGPSR